MHNRKPILVAETYATVANEHAWTAFRWVEDHKAQVTTVETGGEKTHGSEEFDRRTATWEKDEPR